MKPHRRICVGLLLVALGMLSSASALASAPSTTVYPAGDTISASSIQVAILDSGYGVISCTMSGGSFVIPSGSANHNASGPVTMSYTPPSFTGCTDSAGSAQVRTSGLWTVSVQYGDTTPTVTIPTSGLSIVPDPNIPTCEQVNYQGPISLTGVGWFNGFSSPVSVSSAFEWGGPVALSRLGGCLGTGTPTFNWTKVLETLTDVTHPSSLPLVGP